MSTQAQKVEMVYGAIPYSNQIVNLEFEAAGDGIRFDWRGTRYRISSDSFVEEVGDGILIGSDKAILVEHILKMWRLR